MSGSEPSFERRRPGFLQKLFFKAPRWLYRDGPGEIMRRRCVMLLTTTGRKSGLPRTNGVSFMPVDDHFVVFAGWGVRSDWYRNILANPDVTIRIGSKVMPATAVPVAEPERREALMRQMRARAGRCGPPQPIRWILARTGIFDYEGELDMALRQGGNLPVVELFPKATDRR